VPDTAAVEAVTAIADHAFALVDEISKRAVSAFTEHAKPSRVDLVGFDDLVMGVLAGPGESIQGGGFVAAVGALSDTQWWLEWFLKGTDGKPHRLAAETDPAGENFYDYEVLPWFFVPRDTGRRHITGPYVDYVCTDDYTLTFTAPVHVDGRFVGVAGADIRVEDAEQVIRPVLRKVTTPTAVVNAHGRIVCSNSPLHLTGTLLREPDVAKLWTPGEPAPEGFAQIADLPLAVVPIGS
jgi:hypothetical protein